ncbi:MAG: isoprenylcysteine carboxylmethyltransferase family protein [Ignavibacterium sp.]|nr:isoprenylcysteine carboxylmethyltransferase family protein [Ignavibacterium sp.]
MNEIVFKIIFAALFIIYILIRVPFDKEYNQIEKIKTLNAFIEKFLLILMSIGLLFIPLIWLFTPFLNDFKIDFPAWLRIVGTVISIVSLFYFHNIHKTLGANWSPTLEIRKGHQLIKTGPFLRIRHPMYFQIWLWTISQVLIVSNLFAGFSGIIAWSILYFIRVPKEEKMMIDYFGDEYVAYIKQTGRVFPRFYITLLGQKKF